MELKVGAIFPSAFRAWYKVVTDDAQGQLRRRVAVAGKRWRGEVYTSLSLPV
jgi:hypothetical protein